jgi:hypothetical protein
LKHLSILSKVCLPRTFLGLWYSLKSCVHGTGLFTVSLHVLCDSNSLALCLFLPINLDSILTSDRDAVRFSQYETSTFRFDPHGLISNQVWLSPLLDNSLSSAQKQLCSSSSHAHDPSALAVEEWQLRPRTAATLYALLVPRAPRIVENTSKR